MQGHGAAARLPLTGAVRYMEHLRHLPLRIGDYRPSQRGHFFGAQASLHRQQKHHAVARRIAGGGQVAQNRPLLGEANNQWC